MPQQTSFGGDGDICFPCKRYLYKLFCSQLQKVSEYDHNHTLQNPQHHEEET